MINEKSVEYLRRLQKIILDEHIVEARKIDSILETYRELDLASDQLPDFENAECFYGDIEMYELKRQYKSKKFHNHLRKDPDLFKSMLNDVLSDIQNKIESYYKDNSTNDDNSTIVWKGDLKDDCTANWSGLMLRAECMDEDKWWWSVYDMDNVETQIDSSNNYDESCIGGHSARTFAEMAAKMYLKIKNDALQQRLK